MYARKYHAKQIYPRRFVENVTPDARTVVKGKAESYP